jgi:exonuclease SbcD
VERIGFAASLLQNSDVHISRAYDGRVTPVELTDEFGAVNIWLLPYLKPAYVRPLFEDKTIVSYSDALAAAIGAMDVDASVRNVVLSHQFVTGAEPSESEELYVGGSENVDAALYEPFDYVALGHIHRPQHISRETLRYSGTPLKYSIAEAGHTKSVTLVEMGDKGDVRISEIPLTALRDMREIRGTYAELTARGNYIGANLDDYVRIVLTDEEEEPNALMKLRVIYPNLMRLDYDNKRTKSFLSIETAADSDKKTPMELFGELYEFQNGQSMNAEQEAYVRGVFAGIAEVEA